MKININIQKKYNSYSPRYAGQKMTTIVGNYFSSTGTGDRS